MVNKVFRPHHHFVGCNSFTAAVTVARQVLLLLLLQRRKAVNSVVIVFAIHFGVFCEAGLVELDVADAAEKALFVPVLIRGKFHKVPIFDFLATSFTDFLCFFAFDRSYDICSFTAVYRIIPQISLHRLALCYSGGEAQVVVKFQHFGVTCNYLTPLLTDTLINTCCACVALIHY